MEAIIVLLVSLLSLSPASKTMANFGSLFFNYGGFLLMGHPLWSLLRWSVLLKFSTSLDTLSILIGLAQFNNCFTCNLPFPLVCIWDYGQLLFSIFQLWWLPPRGTPFVKPSWVECTPQVFQFVGYVEYLSWVGPILTVNWDKDLSGPVLAASLEPLPPPPQTITYIIIFKKIYLN